VKKLFDSFKMTPNNKYYVINEPRFLRETEIALALAIFSPIFSKHFSVLVGI
jgi:hypothetical protein